MEKNFSCLTFVLLVFSVGLWQNDAQAQCQYIQPDGVKVDPVPVLLEVVGGNLFGDPVPGSDTPQTTHDSWIYLVQGDTTNLHVALIDQKTLETQFSSFPVEPFAFAFADHIVNTANGGLGTCFVTGGGAGGGNLTYAYSSDGLNYNTMVLDTNEQYDSCAIVSMCTNTSGSNTFCDDLSVVAHDVANNTLELYITNNGGMDWVDEGTLKTNVCATVAGCSVPNAISPARMGGIDLLYSRPIGGGRYETILDPETGTTHVIETAPIDTTILKESCSANQGNNNFFALYNSESNTVIAGVEDKDLGDLVLFFKDAPDFNGPGEQGFFGIGCNRFPQGAENPEEFQFGFTFPGGNTFNIKLGPGGMYVIEQVNPSRDPTRQTQSGPVGTTIVNFQVNTPGDEFLKRVMGNSVAYSQSFDYAQCVFTGPASVPTLSEWGLIAMAGVLGIIGLLAIRRRKIVS